MGKNELWRVQNFLLNIALPLLGHTKAEAKITLFPTEKT